MAMDCVGDHDPVLLPRDSDAEIGGHPHFLVMRGKCVSHYVCTVLLLDYYR